MLFTRRNIRSVVRDILHLNMKAIGYTGLEFRGEIQARDTTFIVISHEISCNHLKIQHRKGKGCKTRPWGLFHLDAVGAREKNSERNQETGVRKVGRIHKSVLSWNPRKESVVRRRS